MKYKLIFVSLLVLSLFLFLMPAQGQTPFEEHMTPMQTHVNTSFSNDSRIYASREVSNEPTVVPLAWGDDDDEWDDFDPGGGTDDPDHPDGYVDGPLGNGWFIIVLMTLLFVMTKEVKRRKEMQQASASSKDDPK